MNPLVQKLEDRLLPEFEAVAEKIRQEIPNVNVEVYSIESPQIKWHDFWIDCIFIKDYGEADNVFLGINLHLEETPKIMADVGWGNPSGYREAEFLDELVEISDEVLEDLYKDLPRLYEALFEALKRRKPSNE